MRMTTSFEISSSKYKARTVFFQMHEEKKMKKGSFGGRGISGRGANGMKLMREKNRKLRRYAE